MKVVPYLFFNGDCRAAFEFYAECLGGTIEAILDHSEHPNPEEVPAEHRDLVMHVHLRSGDWELMGSDSPPEMYDKPQGLVVSLHPQSEAEGERIFNSLAEGGEIRMPFESTFWAKKFGMCVDRFGTPWMVNCD